MFEKRIAFILKAAVGLVGLSFAIVYRTIVDYRRVRQRLCPIQVGTAGSCPSGGKRAGYLKCTYTYYHIYIHRRDACPLSSIWM